MNPAIFATRAEPIDGRVLQCFTDNRERYFAQSAATQGGRVPPISVSPSRALVPFTRSPAASANPSPTGAVGGRPSTPATEFPA